MLCVRSLAWCSPPRNKWKTLFSLDALPNSAAFLVKFVRWKTRCRASHTHTYAPSPTRITSKCTVWSTTNIEIITQTQQQRNPSENTRNASSIIRSPFRPTAWRAPENMWLAQFRRSPEIKACSWNPMLIEWLDTGENPAAASFH